MIDFEAFMQLASEMESITDTYSLLLSVKTYKRLLYMQHISKAKLADPFRKIRKCHMRSIVRRRHAAKRMYRA